MSTLQPGFEIELDTTGFYYSVISTKTHPGTFGVTTILKEDVDPITLQKASDKLFTRLKHMNVALKRYWNRDVNVVLDTLLKVQYEENPSDFTAYFNPGECTTRVLYGKNYITMEVLHSVCDGGTLTKVMKALVIEYFRQMGVNVPYMEIDLDSVEDPEEYINAQRTFSNPDAEKTKLKEIHPYALKGTPVTSYLKKYELSISKVKALAKSHGVTITEYIIAMMVLEFDKKRKEDKDTKPILISIPFDMRKFYPTKCLRNFVISVTVSMDSWASLEDLLSQVHNQMKTFDFDGATKILNGSGDATGLLIDKSYEERKQFMEMVDEKLSGGHTMTTIISNVGVVKFPDEIKDRIHHMDFILCPAPTVAYQFSCVTYGDILSMAVTSAIKELEVSDAIMEDLK